MAQSAASAAVDLFRSVAIRRPDGTTAKDDVNFSEMGFLGAFPLTSELRLPVLLTISRQLASKVNQRFFLLTDVTSAKMIDWRVYRVAEKDVVTVGMLNARYGGRFLAVCVVLVERPSRDLLWCPWGHCSPRNVLGWVRLGDARRASAAVNLATLGEELLRCASRLPGAIPASASALPRRPHNDGISRAEIDAAMARRGKNLADIEEERRRDRDGREAAVKKATARVATLYAGPVPPGSDDAPPNSAADEGTKADDYTFDKVMEGGVLNTVSARRFFRHFQTNLFRNNFGMFRVLDVVIKENNSVSDRIYCCSVENVPHNMVWVDATVIKRCLGALETIESARSWKSPRRERLAAAIQACKNNLAKCDAFDVGDNRPPSPGFQDGPVQLTANVPTLCATPRLTRLTVDRQIAWEDYVRQAAKLLLDETGFDKETPSEDAVEARARMLWNGNEQCRQLDSDIAALR